MNEAPKGTSYKITLDLHSSATDILSVQLKLLHAYEGVTCVKKHARGRPPIVIIMINYLSRVTLTVKT